MSTFSDTSPVLIKKRKGDSTDPFIPITENLKVIHNIAVLNEIPDKFKKVNIEGMFEKQTDFYNENNNIGENEYIVDYKLGYVFFNEKVNNTTVKANYLGTGVVLYPSSRIYDTGRTDIIVTIQEMIDGGRKAIEAYGSIDKAIEAAKEYYLKINTTVDLAKKANDELNVTIVNGNKINDLLNNSIKEATDVNNTLGGTIVGGTNKIVEMDNKIKEVNDSELIRKTNEDNRKQEETIRISNENTRKTNEDNRIQAENTREVNEDSRKVNETTRENNEIIRQSAETQRISSEDARKLEENKRVQAEKDRELNETTRQTTYTEMTNTINNISICEEYDSSKQYKKLNRVTLNGSSYECIKDCQGVLPTDTTYWICIAEKGKDGTGSGNMHTSTYDKDGDGVVDLAKTANEVDWNNVLNKPDLSQIGKVQSVNSKIPDVSGNISISASDITTNDSITVEKNITDIKASVQSNLDKIGVLSTLEKEIVDNLTTEKKEINLTNAINYLYQNGGSGNGAVQLGTIQNLTANSNAEGTKATLSWQNPIATEFQKVEIYVSTNDLTSANYNYCTKNATKIVNSNITTFEYNATNGTYYFKAFAIYSIFGVIQNSDGVVTSVTITDTKPPSIVTNIKTITGNAEITLLWNNPNDSDFSKVKIVRKESSKPTSESDGVVVYEGGLTTYKDTSLTNGTNYYYRFFTYDTNNNVNNTDTQFINVIPLANGYDKPVTNFTAQSGNTEITLNWTNPTDSNFSKVMIRKKIGSYPNGITDGDLVYEGNLTTYKNTGLTNGTQYYYRAFTFSANSQYCDTTSGQQVSATPQAFKEYGIRWTKSTDTIERLGDAVGKTAITGGQNDFNSIMPWSGIKRCNLSDSGIVNAYYGSPAYKVDGSNGQVMVEIPKYWYKVVNASDDVIEFWICDGAKSGYEVHPAFFRDRQHLCDDNSGNATEVSYRYIGAYEATEYTGSVYRGGNGYGKNSPTYNSSYKLSSVSGYYPIGNRSMSEFRTLAKNRGNGWGQQDYYLTYAIQLLYLIEYAHFNSQEKIGNGNSNSSTILKTGATDSYGNNSYGTTANTTTAMSYRGIENFYANVWKWIDGLYSDGNRKVFFANKGFTDNCTNYNNSYATGLPSNIGGYISDIWGDKTTGFIPKVASGSGTTKLCDYGSLYGGYVAIFGGHYGYGADCGCFCLSLFYSPSNSSWIYSARLAF